MPKILTAHASDLAPAPYLAARLLPASAQPSTSLFPSSKMHTDDSPTSPTMPGSAASRAIRANPLHRGEACLTCRRRKMKCDAGKPHCGPCSRAGKADECEYEETRFLAQITRLEDENARLQERIRELEGGGGGFLQQQQQQQQFTAFLPGPGRRSPSDAGSSGGQPSPYGQSAPLLVQHPQHPPHPHMSPYHQHYDHHAQLPNIVTQQQQPTMTQDWSSPGGLALQDPIQPHILQRLMHIFARVAAAQFGLPQSSTALLAARRGAGALQEAACAAACVFARPNNGMAAYEAVFLQRASLALARPSPNTNELHDVQAGGVLAVLAFVGGRALEAQRHLGGALRVARALRLEQNDADADRRETWWMLRRAERAWAPVFGELDTPPPLADYVKQEFSPYGVPVASPSIEVDCRGAQLAAHAWALVGDAQSSTAGPNFWHDVQSTTAALERLASISNSPSTTVILHAAQCLLHCAVGARDKARAGALRVAGAINGGGEVEAMDAVVGWWIVQVRASGAADDGALDRAVERARAVWAYVGALRI